MGYQQHVPPGGSQLPIYPITGTQYPTWPPLDEYEPDPGFQSWSAYYNPYVPYLAHGLVSVDYTRELSMESSQLSYSSQPSNHSQQSYSPQQPDSAQSLHFSPPVLLSSPSQSDQRRVNGCNQILSSQYAPTQVSAPPYSSRQQSRRIGHILPSQDSPPSPEETAIKQEDPKQVSRRPPWHDPRPDIVKQRNRKLKLGPHGPLVIRRVSKEELDDNPAWVQDLSARGLLRPVPNRNDAALLRHTDPDILIPPRHHKIDWETGKYINELPLTIRVNTPTDHDSSRPAGIDLTFNSVPAPPLLKIKETASDYTPEQIAHRQEYHAAPPAERRRMRKQGQAFRKDLTAEEMAELQQEQEKLFARRSG